MEYIYVQFVKVHPVIYIITLYDLPDLVQSLDLLDPFTLEDGKGVYT